MDVEWEIVMSRKKIATAVLMGAYLVAGGVLAVVLVFEDARAGEADVIDVATSKVGDHRYDFGVTVRHTDEGWKHYADGWEVLGPDRTVLGTRKLWHPHVDEQPFTRSLSGVTIPDGVSEVIIRAHDSVHGHGGAEIRVVLPVK